jgi:hypothetical protein
MKGRKEGKQGNGEWEEREEKEGRKLRKKEERKEGRRRPERKKEGRKVGMAVDEGRKDEMETKERKVGRFWFHRGVMRKKEARKLRRGRKGGRTCR